MVTQKQQYNRYLDYCCESCPIVQACIKAGECLKEEEAEEEAAPRTIEIKHSGKYPEIQWEEKKKC